MLKKILILSALAVTLVLPFALRPSQETRERADDTLTIITPHNEAIRHEFSVAFRKWYLAQTGRTVLLDWRVIGGTSDIARFLESEYVSAFRNHWTGELKRPWSTEVQAGFANSRLPSDAPAVAKEAREVFLNSDVGCRIDLFFGGGSYDFIQQANAGRLVPSRVFEQHPEWFADSVIPSAFAGEPYWDENRRWIGNVLSSYGILYNRDSLKRLGIDRVPSEWGDLTNPKYVGEVALADPTKSSSIAKAFENLIQQQMQRRLRELQADGTRLDANERTRLEMQAVRDGWTAGMQMLQLIGANARYFTDSSQKPPIDVSQGDCAVGICIDFYGRSQAEVTGNRGGGEPRLGFVTPRGGTVSSVDPIAIMRGAPHREVAERFIEFTLSMDGQKLWNFRPGTPGGPSHYALRRLPIRRDFYENTEWKGIRSDPEAEPFAEGDNLVYQPAWTGGVFREMAFIMRVMTLDTHKDLVQAWRAIDRASEPRKRQALAALQNLDAVGVTYDQARNEIKKALSSKNKVDEITLARDLGERFRQRYAEAMRIADGRD
jgi:ABC-type Fe3+ transport system substrate-binding protein